MVDASNFRKWATQMAREAGEEPDTAQAQHFLSVAEYWLQLADEAELSQAAPKRECPA